MEEEDVQLLFGPRVPKNRGFSSQRIDWINRMFVPLAEAYLQAAVEEVAQAEQGGGELDEISHTNPEIVDPAVLESLDQICTKLRGPGYYDFNQELGLRYEKAVFEEVVHEVFDDLLFDFCTRMAEYQADVLLLAGQPTKLGYLQELVRKYLPLPPTRIIPMFHHYAGNWYPYQDVKGNKPGLIVDPKSAVVVGAAIEFMARNGMLSQFKFSMQGKDKENTYFWGVMTESTSTIREERVLFHPVEDPNTKDEWTEFTHDCPADADRPQDDRRRVRPGDADLRAENGDQGPHRADRGDRPHPPRAGHRGNRGAPGTGFGHRHRRRTAGRAGRKRVLQLADAGRRELLPGHRRPGQHRNRPVTKGSDVQNSILPAQSITPFGDGCGRQN